MLKKVAIGFVALVSFIVIGGGVFLSVIDWNEYRETLEETAYDATGVKVDLAGNIGISFLPTPSLKAESLTLINPDDQTSTVIATARQIDVELSLGDLLAGEVAFSKLNLIGLELNVSETADGFWQIQGLPNNSNSTDSTDQEAQDTPESTENTEIKLDKFQLSGARINFVSATNEIRTVEGVDIALTGVFPNGPLDWEGQAFVEGERIGVSGRLRPVANRAETSIKTDLDIAGASVSLSGRYGRDVGLVGRTTISGDNLTQFLSGISKVSGTDTTFGKAVIPFLVDLQIEGNGGVYSIVSKQLDVNQTRGRLDLTVALLDERSNLTGSLSLGVVDSGLWEAFSIENSSAQNDSDIKRTPEDIQAINLPITGTLDTTIEGIIFSGDTIRNVDTVLEITKNRVVVSKFQALLPGGTGIAAQMAVDLENGLQGNGGISFISGQFPAFLNWLGLSVHETLPAGRLATSKVAAKIQFDSRKWQVMDIEGNIDTTNFSGSIDGDYTGAYITDVVLDVDQVNLDAYLANNDSGTDAKVEKKPGGTGQSQNITAYFPKDDLSFQLNGKSLSWRDRQFTNIAVDGQAGPKGVRVSKFTSAQGKGSLNSTVAVELAGAGSGDLRYELNSGLSNWPLDIIREFAPQVVQYIDDLNLKTATGNLSVSGPIDNLTVVADFRHSREIAWTLSGDIGVIDNALGKASLQGKLEHNDLSKVLHTAGLSVNQLPVDVTLSLEKDANSEAITIKVNGNVESGQLIADTILMDADVSADFSFNHPNAGGLLKNMSLNLPVPDPASGISLRSKASLKNDIWSLNGTEIRNGNAVFTGNLTGQGKRLSGDISLQNWSINSDTISFGQSEQSAGARQSVSNQASSESFNFAGYEEYLGDINITLDNIDLFGQSLSLQNARLTIGDGYAFLGLGQNASLNLKPVTGRFTVGLKAVPTIEVEFSAEYIDLAEMLTGAGYSDFISGDSSVNFALTTQGQNTKSLIRNLNGQGNFLSEAGTLSFLDVPSLVNDIRSASSGRSFLGVIGSRLRGGNTTFGKLETRFTFDSGVALIEAFQADGNWGQLGLDGQVNLVDEFMDIQGSLALSQPLDAPAIPVNYRGPLSAPTGEWQSRALERFVLAGIERRLRSSIFQGFEKADSNGEQQKPKSAGSSVFESAFGILSQLKKKQQRKKDDETKPDGGN